ncbi:MAG TPA: methyltransferase [Vicinamibacterales bacterium]|jgi:protein-S-isoprenylcysteine O-methyltransferase Ste14|nr:methyltransferase [Vicinamibacterales bacterium]
MIARTLARWRVPLGFVAAAVVFVLARPSWRSWSIGLAIALAGAAVRVWAAGHLEKSREITRSGPYRFIRHPLYAGSLFLGIGFAVAAHTVVVAVIAIVYLGVTLAAAIRTEEAFLDQKFDGAYTAYRAGRAEPVMRRFSWGRVRANREYRAVVGLAAAFALLVLKMKL